MFKEKNKPKEKVNKVQDNTKKITKKKLAIQFDEEERKYFYFNIKAFILKICSDAKRREMHFIRRSVKKKRKENSRKSRMKEGMKNSSWLNNQHKKFSSRSRRLKSISNRKGTIRLKY